MLARLTVAVLLFAQSQATLAAPPASSVRCDLHIFNADEEGTATNVRAGPSTASRVLLTLDADATVELHVTGRSGNWFSVNRIDDVDADKNLFRGIAWIHRSQAGLSVAGGGERHHLRAAPSAGSKSLMRLTADGHMLDLLDCKGDWVKVIVDGKKSGWMAPDAQCSNPMTTCS